MNKEIRNLEDILGDKYKIIPKNSNQLLLDELLKDWRDPLSAHEVKDAEDIIHMLLVELAGKDAVISSLAADIAYYKTRNHW